MTTNEAIERIKDHIGRHFDEEPHAIYISKALHMAVKALEKQIPEKPKLDNDNGIYETEHCPNCNRKLFPNEHHCKCGQALNWSGENIKQWLEQEVEE